MVCHAMGFAKTKVMLDLIRDTLPNPLKLRSRVSPNGYALIPTMSAVFDSMIL